MIAGVERLRGIAGSALAWLVLVGMTVASPAVAAPNLDIVSVSDDLDEVQAVFVEATSGQFRLEFRSDTGVAETGDLPATASAAEVEAALNSLPTITAGGGSVAVQRTTRPDQSGTQPFLVTFNGGPMARSSHPLLKVKPGGIALGGSPLFDGVPLAYATNRRPGGAAPGDRVTYQVAIKNSAAPGTGIVDIGDTLRCEGATFGPAAAPSTLTYEWRVDGAPVGGETEQTYVVRSTDTGKAIQCVVLGTNANAASKIASLNPAVVAPQIGDGPPKAADPRVGAGRPTVTGTGTNPRTCNLPTNWEVLSDPPATFSDPADFSFQWLRNGQPISGATSNVYTPGAEDTGKVIQCEVKGIAPGGVTVGISNISPVSVTQPPNPSLANTPSFPDPNGTSGPVTAVLELPAGSGSKVIVGQSGGTGWSCGEQPASGSEPGRAVCETAETKMPGESFAPLTVAIAVGGDAPDPATVTMRVSGGGATGTDTASTGFGIEPPRVFGFLHGQFEARALDATGKDAIQAGGHPALAVSSFSLTRNRLLVQNQNLLVQQSVELIRSAKADIPPGFIGNPQALPDVCASTADLLEDPPNCPAGSVVGELAVAFSSLGDATDGPQYKRMALFAIRPEAGVPAQFAAVEAFNKGVYVMTPRLRPEDGYAISIDVEGIVEAPPVLDARATLCSYGANTVEGGGSVVFRSCKKKGDPEALTTPFLTSQTACFDSPPVTTLRIDSWRHPGVMKEARAVAPKMDGCAAVPFTPTLDLRPTAAQAESASGLDVDLSIPSDGLEDPDGLSQAHLKRTTVTLPAGMSVNPGAADGLAACTQAQLGMSNGVPNNEPVRCPDASKIGTATVKTPILEETLTGNIYLAKQGENPFGTLMALYLVVESKERGVLIKIPGKVEFRGNGQVVSTFDDNPQAPFSSLKLHFNSGPRASLLTPARCGTYQIVSQMTPWSAADPDNPTPAETRTQTSTFQVTSGPGGGPCPDGSLQPQFKAGLTNFIAGGSSPFVMNIARADATQRFNGLDLTLPPGMTAKLKGVPYCPDAVLNSIPGAEGTGAAELANPSCPAASRLGSVAVGAGAGKPFYVNTGSVYLAGPYKGAPVSLAAVVPAVAGPFDLGNVVVRSAVYVNPKTTQITVKTDPLPTHLHGVPLDVRDMRVTVDRPDFTRAPTNCNEMAVTGVVYGEHGAAAPVSNRFQVGECGSLGFKPKMQLRLKGGTARNKYQQLTATVWARKGDANISRAAVTFPRSIFLAQEHIRTVCTRVQFAANNCPKGSIYGRAEAISPLLDEPLKGPVYLRSSDNLLPDLVAALQGPAHQPIKVELSGRTDSKNKGLRNTFDIVPDAPVTKFTLRMQGGKKSLLVTSRNICKRKERATVRLNGQNGRRHNFRQTLKVVKCKKAKKKAPARHRRR